MIVSPEFDLSFGCLTQYPYQYKANDRQHQTRQQFDYYAECPKVDAIFFGKVNTCIHTHTHASSEQESSFQVIMVGKKNKRKNNKNGHCESTFYCCAKRSNIVFNLEVIGSRSKITNKTEIQTNPIQSNRIELSELYHCAMECSQKRCPNDFLHECRAR